MNLSELEFDISASKETVPFPFKFPALYSFNPLSCRLRFPSFKSSEPLISALFVNARLSSIKVIPVPEISLSKVPASIKLPSLFIVPPKPLVLVVNAAPVSISTACEIVVWFSTVPVIKVVPEPVISFPEITEDVPPITRFPSFVNLPLFENSSLTVNLFVEPIENSEPLFIVKLFCSIDALLPSTNVPPLISVEPAPDMPLFNSTVPEFYREN